MTVESFYVGIKMTGHKYRANHTYTRRVHRADAKSYPYGIPISQAVNLDFSFEVCSRHRTRRVQRELFS
ncbi:hypothetical protein [Camellia virus A]|uniref:Uncharacterized protein n=1 Tax=Camellia virus A TaxID=2899887 RepID=A0AAX2ZLI2_9SECO|nr:hypothetical protein QKU84_gp3 [Camellia virus A]UFX17412.1 hypothetical protein [Camellia virus A]